jgi:hypothetical protein
VKTADTGPRAQNLITAYHERAGYHLAKHMHLELPVDERDNFALPATRVLQQIPEEAYRRHDSLGFRSALGLYNTSVATLAHRLTRVTGLVNGVTDASGVRGEPDRTHKENLIESYEGLLHSLMHHMEDCVSVIKGFLPTDSAIAKSAAAKTYGKNVRPYRSHIGIVVNRIKHQQGRLRLMTVRLGDFRFAGYFVERGLTGGSVGPDPDIHEAGLTAFSFNRDLRYHLCHVFLASAELARAVERLTGAPRSLSVAVGQPLGQGLHHVMVLPETYFPDEYEKPRPVLRLEGTASTGRQLRVGFDPSDGWRPFAGRTFEVSLELPGDGATRSWKVPYTSG